MKKALILFFIMLNGLSLKAQSVLTPWDSVPGINMIGYNARNFFVFKNELYGFLNGMVKYNGGSDWEPVNIPGLNITQIENIENSGDTSVVISGILNGISQVISWNGNQIIQLTNTYYLGQYFLNHPDALYFYRPYEASDPGDTLRLVKWKDGAELQSWKVLPSPGLPSLYATTSTGFLIKAVYIEGYPMLNYNLGQTCYSYNGNGFQGTDTNGKYTHTSCNTSGGSLLVTYAPTTGLQTLQLFNGTISQLIGSPEFNIVKHARKIKNNNYICAFLDTSSYVYTYTNGTYLKVNPNQDFKWKYISNVGPTAGDTVIDPGGVRDVVVFKDYLYVIGFFNMIDNTDLKNGIARCKMLNMFNNAPSAANDNYSATDTSSYSFNVKQNDVDTNGDYLYTTILTPPVHGTANVNSNDEIIYSPNIGFGGLDSIQYKVCDLGDACATAWVYITVDQVSSLPILENDSILSSVNSQIEILVLNNDDLHGQSGALSILNQPQHGTATVMNDTTIQYSTNAGFWGLDSLTYKVCRTYGLCDSATVIIRTNRIPTAINDYVYLDASNTFEFAPITNDSDADGDPLITSWQNGTLPSGAMVENGSSPGLLKYTNPNLQIGEMDSIRYILEDSYLFRDTAWVYVQREGTGSLSEISQNEITTYPNPNNGSFFINTKFQIRNIEIQDVLGRKMDFEWIKNENKIVIIDAQPHQVYLIQLTTQSDSIIYSKILTN